MAAIIKKAALAAAAMATTVFAGEAVKYRGIFINDEDWGLRPWAVKHFGKDEGIGVGAYREIFSMMKADGLNLLWPAMHEGGYEFSSRPENLALAGEWGIRVGTSHCEPMLRNNCYIPKKDRNLWSWTKHRDFVTGYWKESVDCYATNDVLWTIGMRGIHDGKMNDGTNTQQKIEILEDVFAAQVKLLEDAGVGDAPKLFVPYKEVLPIFNAGLKVPKGTTIMWVNDNFGYIRRLGGPQCNEYGGGIYWHAGYHGRPHGYLHLCTTPPAFMWYELVAKCSQNGVRDVWMVNVGDVFQAEIAMFALGKFAADPDGWAARPNAQDEVLRMWVKEQLLQSNAIECNRMQSTDLECNRMQSIADRIADHLNEFYALGFIRKPEHMCIQWTSALPEGLKAELLGRYAALLAEDEAIEAALPENLRDLYFRKVGFQTRFLAHAGLIHLEGKDAKYAHSVIDPLYARWDGLEGGKWSGFWCDTIGAGSDQIRQKSNGNRWSTQMQWAWNEPANPADRRDYYATAFNGKPEPRWLTPAQNTPAPDGSGAWIPVKGLGTSANALALLPVKPGAGQGAAVEFELAQSNAVECNRMQSNAIIIQFLPDFALWPGLGLGVEVAFDGGERRYVAVPKSDSNIGEKDPVRNRAVQDNFIRVKIPVPQGAKRVSIYAKDPGVVIDRVGVE